MTISKPSVSTAHKLTRNISFWGVNRPAYLVIHFTGGLTDTPSAQLATYKSYLEAGSNAHYLVGSDGIWEMVDPEIYYTRCSVGASCDKKSECVVKGWGPAAYRSKVACDHAGVAGHQNCISVEICSAKAGRKICDPLDPGWYFTDDTYARAVELSAWICDHWSIKTPNIIMHNQITGKLCPAMWCNADGAEKGFFKFREDVAYRLNDIPHEALSPTAAPDKTKITVPQGAYFYSRPTASSARIGQATNNLILESTLEQNGFCYTEQGWVQP